MGREEWIGRKVRHCGGGGGSDDGVSGGGDGGGSSGGCGGGGDVGGGDGGGCDGSGGGEGECLLTRCLLMSCVEGKASTVPAEFRFGIYCRARLNKQGNAVSFHNVTTHFNCHLTYCNSGTLSNVCFAFLMLPRYLQWKSDGAISQWK